MRQAHLCCLTQDLNAGGHLPAEALCRAYSYRSMLDTSGICGATLCRRRRLTQVWLYVSQLVWHQAAQLRLQEAILEPLVAQVRRTLQKITAGHCGNDVLRTGKGLPTPPMQEQEEPRPWSEIAQRRCPARPAGAAISRVNTD